MSNILLPKHPKVLAIENALLGLSLSGPSDIRVPTRLLQPQFGGTASLLQLLITWAHSNPTSQIQTYIPEGPYRETAIREFVNSDHGLTACLLDRALLSQSGTDITAPARRAALEHLERMHDVDGATRGMKLFITCKDHSALPLPATLYEPGDYPAVRRDAGFEDFTLRMLHRIIRGPTPLKRPGGETLRALTIVLREIFKNTHDWAQTDAHERPFSPSIRALRIEQYTHSAAKHLQMAKDDERLTRFLSSAELHDRKGLQRLLEISILDSGPGIPSRFLLNEYVYSFKDWPSQNTSISPSSEYAALMECLKKHKSSGEPYRGNGLHAMMSALSAFGGFVRLRSGRLLLYRDFTTKRYNLNDDREPYLLDYHMAASMMTTRAPARGSLLTMLLPIPNETAR